MRWAQTSTGFWEVKQPSGKWVAFRDIPTNRDYTWFRIIAGVRGYGDNTFHHHRGMPADSSDCWKDYVGNDDLHSHTWLTPDEVLDCFEEWLEAVKRDYNELPDDAPKSRSKMCVFPEEPIKRLLFRYFWDDTVGQWGDRAYKSIPWVGTLKDLIGDQDFEQSVRMVIAFDS